MTSKNYYANNHIITCLDSATDVYIKPGPGKTLHIDGVVTNPSAQGIDGSVQFNSLNDLAGDSSFLYDTINNVLSINNVNTDLVEKIVSSDSLGYNQIYDGPSEPFPATVGSSHAETVNNFGYDVEVSEINDTIVFACPTLPYGPLGGIDVFTRSGTSFVEYSNALTFSNFTLQSVCSSTSISDNGLYCTLCDGSQDAYIYLFKKTGSTWALLTDNMSIVRHQAKISMTLPTLITMLSVDRSSIFSITEIDLAGTFGTPVTIFNDAGVVPNEGYLPMAIHQYFCMINVGGNSKYYQRIAGVWTLIDTISGAVNECDICSVSQTHYVSAYSRTSGGLIIKTSYGTQTFSGNYGAVTCNDSRIFAYNTDNSEIQIYNIQNDQSFVKSVNNTAITGINKMSASYSYLAASQTADNQATIFKIQEYTNHDVELIKISLDSTTQKVEITSPSGVDISSDLTVSGVIYTTPNVLGATSPELQMSSGGSGLHYNSNTVSTLINYTPLLDVNENYIQGNKQHRAVSGSLSSPGYSFIGDTDSGMYRMGANNLGLALNGIKQIDYGTVRTTFTNPILAPAGTAALPGLATGFNNCGLYQFGSAIGLSVSGVSQLTTDATHTVTTNPFKHLTNGSASVPSFSWVNSGNSGMYYSTNEVNFTVNGTKAGSFTSNTLNVDNVVGRTTSNTTLNMGTTFQVGVGGAFRMRAGVNGNNLCETSFGNYCDLSSQNPTGGAVLKVVNNLTNKIGIEQVLLNGATNFQNYYATSTQVGSIGSTGAITTFSTTSDYRIKQNIQPLVNQLDRIDLLNPVSYDWTHHNSSSEGFVAHELQVVFPQAVTGEKDAVGPDGTPKLQGIDTSFLIGSLVSCIKELKAEINAMKLRMDAMQTEIDTFV